MEKRVSIGILCGGRSRRFGSDKRDALLEGKTFLNRLLSSFSSSEILVSVAKDSVFSSPSCRIVRDEREDCGPLEGLRSLLKNMSTEFLFLVPVDMPLIDSSVLEAFLEAMDEETEVVLPLVEGHETPLPGLYRRSVLPLVEEALGEGNLKLMDTVHKCRSKAIGLQTFGLSPVLFQNINSQEDYRSLLSSMERAGK